MFDGGSVVVDAERAGALPRAVVRGRALRRRARRRAAASSSQRDAAPAADAAARRARLSRLGARHARLRRQERLSAASCSGCPAASTRRSRSRSRSTRSAPNARARGHDAVALHVADEHRRRGGGGAPARRAFRHAVDRAVVRDDARDCSAIVFAGLPRRRDRGEHPGALPRHPVDGDLEQARRDAAHDGQQERDGRRLRDLVRRHGGRIRAAQGLHEDARLPARRAIATESPR